MEGLEFLLLIPPTRFIAVSWPFKGPFAGVEKPDHWPAPLFAILKISGSIQHNMEATLGWVIGIGIVVLVIWALNASGNKEGEAKLGAVASVMGTEDAFRRYWRHFNERLSGDELPHEVEDLLVSKYLGRHQDIARLIGSMTAANQKVMGPVVEKQSDQLDDDILPLVSPSAAAKWRAMTKKEQSNFVKRFAGEELGLKV